MTAVLSYRSSESEHFVNVEVPERTLAAANWRLVQGPAVALLTLSARGVQYSLCSLPRRRELERVALVLLLLVTLAFWFGPLRRLVLYLITRMRLRRRSRPNSAHERRSSRYSRLPTG